MKVDVCVTTAPRDPCTLPRCRQSLLDAGWDSVTVYAEPHSDLRCIDRAKDRVVQRRMKFGAWRNWLFAALDMVERSNADGILIVQDDTEWRSDARNEIEKQQWPCKNVGYIQCAVSLGYSKWCREKTARIVRLPDRMVPTVMGAWGTLFPRQVLAKIVEWGLVNGWHGNHLRRGESRWEPDPALRKAVDSFFGKAASALHLSAWVYNPSLAQHLCRDRGSTLNHDKKFGHALAIRSALGWEEPAR